MAPNHPHLVPPIRIRLRELREARGLTQKELSAHAGTSESAIVKLERGETVRVELATLERLCAALSVEPGEMIVRGSVQRGGA
jgi:DNA-binding Xre family transcriptional regulator